MRILLTGSHGMIGSALAGGLQAEGHEVVRMVRAPAASDRTMVLWDPAALAVAEQCPLENLDVAVHLAGAGVAESRWTPEFKSLIRNSRVQGTALLANTLAGLRRPPPVLVSASAIGFYGNRGDEELTEDSPAGAGFFPGLCRDWEAAADPAADAGIRVVKLRIGMVLGRGGGALKRLVPLFRYGAGGRLGSGRQFMSWIALDDLVGAIRFAIATSSLSGPVNAVAPRPPPRPRVRPPARARGNGRRNAPPQPAGPPRPPPPGRLRVPARAARFRPRRRGLSRFFQTLETFPAPFSRHWKLCGRALRGSRAP